MPLVPHAVVLPISALGHKVRAYRIVFVSKLQSILRRNPVRPPALNRAAHAPYRIADQVAVIGVAVAVLIIPVVEIADVMRLSGRLAIRRLHVEVELRQAGKRVT